MNSVPGRIDRSLASHENEDAGGDREDVQQLSLMLERDRQERKQTEQDQPDGEKDHPEASGLE